MNEPNLQPPMPADAEVGILKGLYKLRPRPTRRSARGSISSEAGPSCAEVLRAQTLLAAQGVAADVWSVTSYSELRRDALSCERWNRLHPASAPSRRG